eukprot:g23209.t1
MLLRSSENRKGLQVLIASQCCFSGVLQRERSVPCPVRWTTVEFPATSSSVRFSMPELWVKHSSHRLGAGSTYEWHGPATFSDNLGNQCQLSFGHFEKGRGVPQEDIKGVLRDARGAEVGRIHGSWLGPLLCDGEADPSSRSR